MRANRVTYDTAADAAYVYLVGFVAPGAVAQTRPAMLELDQAFIAFDFDSEGKILGIEILGASRVLSKETLESADELGTSD